MNAEEFYKYDQEELSYRKCSTKDCESVDYNDYEQVLYSKEQLIAFSEAYHKQKLKLLGIADVVGQSEQLCKHKRVIKSRLRMEDGKSRYCKDCQEWLT